MLRPGIDYNLDGAGRFVLTREYLLGRGGCCGSGCLNCPWGAGTVGLEKNQAVDAGRPGLPMEGRPGDQGNTHE